MQKTAPKNTKYSRNKTILKIPHLAKAIAHAKAIAFAKLIIFNQKLKMQKNKGKTILQQHCRWSVQKTAPKNTKYSRNDRETLFEIGHLAKAIAHAKAIAFEKLVIFGQKLKMQKRREKRFYNDIIVGLCKKPLQKTPNVREIRPFCKSAIFQRL